MAAKDRRNQEIVEVRDPNGKIHKMPRPNATDMISHLGWKMVIKGPNIKSKAVKALEVTPEQEDFARADRTLRPRDVERLEAKDKEAAAALVVDEAAEDLDLQPAAATRRRTPRTKAKKDDDGNGIEAMTALRPQITGDDDLSSLENDEDSRVPRDE